MLKSPINVKQLFYLSFMHGNLIDWTIAYLPFDIFAHLMGFKSHLVWIQMYFPLIFVC